MQSMKIIRNITKYINDEKAKTNDKYMEIHEYETCHENFSASSHPQRDAPVLVGTGDHGIKPVLELSGISGRAWDVGL